MGWGGVARNHRAKREGGDTLETCFVSRYHIGVANHSDKRHRPGLDSGTGRVV